MPHTLALCFTQSQFKFTTILALSSTHCFTHLLFTCSHLWTHLHMEYKTTFDHQIHVCGMKCNLCFCFGRCRGIRDDLKSTHKCRSRFEDGDGTCGMVLHINRTFCNNGSEYQSHVMELPTYNCLRKRHEHH